MRILQLFVVLIVALNQATAKPHAREKSEKAFDEHSSYFEADILADKYIEIKGKKGTSEGNLYSENATDEGYVAPRMSLTDNTKLWKGGKVPYVIGFEPGENQYVYINIVVAIKTINEVGCVQLYEATNETDAVRINLGTDYSSHLGRQGGVQDITVSKDNSNLGTIMHEIMHTLGFGHEHNRPDRDNYIIIHWDNIKEESKSYFQKYKYDTGLTNNSLDYDYRSLMHATNQENADISIDSTKAIIERIGGGIDLGQRAYLTDLDIERIRITYRCGLCGSANNTCFLFRYPGDCTKYYQCTHDKAVVRDCNENLHFNDIAGYCDYPSIAGCVLR